MANIRDGICVTVIGCGCIYDSLGIIYCPKHKSAPDLYEACKLAEKLLAIGVGAEPLPIPLMIERAIAKAEGK